MAFCRICGTGTKSKPGLRVKIFMENYGANKGQFNAFVFVVWKKAFWIFRNKEVYYNWPCAA